MNEIQIFSNAEFGEIRTMTDEHGEVWFVGKDVAERLGYVKPRNAIADHVDEDDTLKWGVTDSLGRNQETILINESGLYSLVLSSKLPTAKKFKRWVTSEVLPTIRKHGAYMTENVLEQTIQNPDYMIGLLNELKAEQEKRKALQTTVAIQNQQIQEMQPKASYYDLVLNCKDLLSTTEISKDYGKSAVWLNNYLHKKGVQFKQSGIWFLYQKYAEQGYTSTKTHNYNGNDGSQHCKPHTYWTQKGRLFIYELLKNDGIVPLIELEQLEELPMPF